MKEAASQPRNMRRPWPAEISHSGPPNNSPEKLPFSGLLLLVRVALQARATRHCSKIITFHSDAQVRAKPPLLLAFSLLKVAAKAGALQSFTDKAALYRKSQAAS